MEAPPTLTYFNHSARAPRLTLNKATLVALSQPSPPRIIRSTLLTWGWILAAFLLYFTFGSAWAFAISFVVIGAQQHALSIWVHEGSHYHLARSQRLNDLMCNILYAAPILISVESYRSRHLTHHHHLGQPQDSEKHPRTCIRGWRLPVEIFRALSGIYALRLFVRYNSKDHINRSLVNVLSVCGTHSALFLFTLLTGHWPAYFTLWILPLLTLAVALTAFRAIAEHQPWSIDRPVAEDETIEPVTRSIRSNTIEKIFFAPLNFHLHLEHDLFPDIPYHNLPAIHRELETMGYFIDTHRIHRGSYISLLFALAFPKTPLRADPVNAR